MEQTYKFGLFDALSKAQAAMKGAVKDSTNPHFRSRYADLESVIEAIRKPFADNGLCFSQRVADGMLVTTIAHESGESFESAVPLIVTPKLIHEKDKSGNILSSKEVIDSQVYGSALTYSRRYGLAAAAGVSQTDDDGNAACEAPKPVFVASNPVPAASKPVPAATVTSTAPEVYRHIKHRELCLEEARKVGHSANMLLLHKEKLVPFLEANATTGDLGKWIEVFFTKELAGAKME